MATWTATFVMFLVIVAPLALLAWWMLRFYRSLSTEPEPDRPELIPATKVCRYCGQVLQQEWTHCPFCGKEADPPLTTLVTPVDPRQDGGGRSPN